MNPYPRRIAELHDHLERRYGQRDRQATEILLASLLDRDLLRARRAWIVLETDYPSRDVSPESPAWFMFGGENRTVESMSSLRTLARRYRVTNVTEQWLKDRETAARTLVESEWRRLQQKIAYVNAMTVFGYQCLMATSIRLRADYPRGDFILRPDREADRMELARLARRVLSSDHRDSRPMIANEDRIPAGLMYWCELLQKLCPMQTDWETLIGSLTSIARGISILYADGREPDWAAAERIMRDSIHATTRWIIEECIKYDGRGGADGLGLRSRGMSVNDREHDIYSEIKRLLLEQVLVGRQRYRVSAVCWRELIGRDTRILI
jgi:hypothetical protein